MNADRGELIVINGLCPATAAIIGCTESPPLHGIGIEQRDIIKAAMPHNLVLVQTMDGGIWSWLISHELLREARQ